MALSTPDRRVFHAAPAAALWRCVAYGLLCVSMAALFLYSLSDIEIGMKLAPVILAFVTGTLSFTYWRQYRRGAVPAIEIDERGVRDLRLTDTWIEWESVRKLGWSFEAISIHKIYRLPINDPSGSNLPAQRRALTVWIEVLPTKAGKLKIDADNSIYLEGGTLQEPFDELRLALSEWYAYAQGRTSASDAF